MNKETVVKLAKQIGLVYEKRGNLEADDLSPETLLDFALSVIEASKEIES